MATISSHIVLNGLESSSTSIPIAGFYNVRCDLNLPTIPESSPSNSQVVATFTQNGTPVYTSKPGDLGAQFNLSCAAGDVIAVVLSSGAAIDQPTNVVRGTVVLG